MSNKFNLIVLISVFNLLLIINFSIGQGPLGFPDPLAISQIPANKLNADNRLPLYYPKECKDNELFYPGDQKDDWVCDCLPGFVFHPDTNQCYGLYLRGPCENKHYLTIKDGRSIPDCEPNPCEIDKRVPFRGRCHELYTAGPCRYPKLSYVVSVNVTTLKLDCIKQSASLQHINFDNRFNPENPDEENIDFKFPDIIPICAVGSKRAINEICEPSNSIFVNNTNTNV